MRVYCCRVLAPNEKVLTISFDKLKGQNTRVTTENIKQRCRAL